MSLVAVYRIIVCFCAGAACILLLGTISPRLFSADQPWMYLLVGGALGVVAGSLDPLSRLFPETRRFLTMPIFSGIVLAICLITLATIRLAAPGCTMNWVGVMLGTVLITLAGMFLQALVDERHA